MTAGTNCNGCVIQNYSMMPLGMDIAFQITMHPEDTNKNGKCECIEVRDSNGVPHQECTNTKDNNCKNKAVWTLKFLNSPIWRLRQEDMPPFGDKVIMIDVNQCGERRILEYDIIHYLSDGTQDPTNYGKLKFVAECTGCAGNCPD